MPWGGVGGQNLEHPHTLAILSFFFFFFPSNAFGFFGKAQFRRAMLSCDSSNFLLPLLKHFGCYGNLKVSINLQLEK